MSIEHYIMYDLSGAYPPMKGSGPPGAAALQQPHAGWVALTIPDKVYNGDLAEYPDEIRVALWERVKIIRDIVIGGGAVTPFGAVDTDDTSRSNINGATTAAMIAMNTETPFTMTWTMADNTEVALLADDVLALGLAVVAHVNAAHENARTLRAAIDGAEDTTALLQVDIGAGWGSDTP